MCALTNPHKFNFDMSSNISALSAGANSAFIPYPQLNNALLNAGIFINDVAIDADNGDAYFTDSPNCREDATSNSALSPLTLNLPCVRLRIRAGIMKVAMRSAGLADATVSVW